jgi:SAM-dependent MidA family methyltransferase
VAAPQTTLERILVALIEEHGPLTFARYQEVALYDRDHGYYAAGPPRTGPAGHFLTSPEVDPAFGELWGRAFAQLWEACGRPSDFEVVEIGPGEGSFAAAVLDTSGPDFAAALTYRLVERLPALAERQIARLAGHDNVVWSSSVDEVGHVPAGCVFANEVADNLPVHLVEMHDDGLVELYVVACDGRLALEPGPPSSPEVEAPLARDGVVIEAGCRYEVGLAAQRLAGAAARIVGRGAVVFVDYGDHADQLALRPGGTVTAYSSGGADDRALERPGERDITSHANWTAIGRALGEAGCDVVGPIGQRAVLKALGLDGLHDRLRAVHERALRDGDGPRAVRALSRRQALGALGDPGGLGGLGVLAGCRDVAPPPFLASAGDS